MKIKLIERIKLIGTGQYVSNVNLKLKANFTVR